MKSHFSSLLLSSAILLAVAGCAHPGATASSTAGTTRAASNPNAFPSTRPATGKTVFIFEPQYAAWGLYNPQGDLVRTGPASGGKDYCPDVGRPCRTVVGTFTTFREGGPGCVSSKFPLGEGGAPMPNCMFFHGGYAIHGSNDVPNHNASHGCIRVTPSDAAWLDEHMNPGATVIVRPYS